MSLPQPLPRSVKPFALLRWSGVAFVYWLVCMTALEPGNLAGMIDAGHRPDWGGEALRLVVAGLLGASVTPVLAALADRFPLARARRLRHGLVQAGVVLALMLVLVLVSTLLVAWLLEGRAAPAPGEIRRELFANGLLLVACLSGFLAILQFARGPATVVEIEAPDIWPAQLAVTGRGRVTLVEVAAIDWIETQGNYQALHAAGATHLMRATSAGLAARLDPARFVRIHRRAMVALDRVAELKPLANGDGLVRLRDGTELKLTRSFREGLRRKLDGN
jgi:hypothetical protein